MMKKREFVFAAALALVAPLAFAEQLPLVEVWKSDSCGCCGEWVKHLQKNGFPTKVHRVEDASPVRRALGMPDRLGSCHTAKVGGYVIEGHVPAKDIQRLLKEKPKAVGLTAPGMPAGSPGMDIPNSPPYDIYLVQSGGRPVLYARHNGPEKPSTVDKSQSCAATADPHAGCGSAVAIPNRVR